MIAQTYGASKTIGVRLGFFKDQFYLAIEEALLITNGVGCLPGAVGGGIFCWRLVNAGIKKIDQHVDNLQGIALELKRVLQ